MEKAGADYNLLSHVKRCECQVHKGCYHTERQSYQ